MSATEEQPAKDYPIVVEFATPGSSASYAWQARQPGGDGHMYNENGMLWEDLTDEERATWEHVAQQAHEAHLPCFPDRHVYPDEIDEDPPDEESEA